MSYRVGFDVGGTFTDFVLQSPAGELTTAKRLTTYPDPSEACLAGLDGLLACAGVAWADVAQAVHGTTLGSNIVIERKARGVGLLTTRGFRDVLIIGREKRYQVYDLQIEAPPPLVPRRLIGEVTERVLADGSVRTPLGGPFATSSRVASARWPSVCCRRISTPSTRSASPRSPPRKRRTSSSPSRTRCRPRSASTSEPRRPSSTHT